MPTPATDAPALPIPLHSHLMDGVTAPAGLAVVHTAGPPTGTVDGEHGGPSGCPPGTVRTLTVLDRGDPAVAPIGGPDPGNVGPQRLPTPAAPADRADQALRAATAQSSRRNQALRTVTTQRSRRGQAPRTTTTRGNRADRAPWTITARGDRRDRAPRPATARAGDAQGGPTPLVDSPGTVALLDRPDLGVTTIPIRGYDPVDDAVDHGRHLVPLVKHEPARRSLVSA